MSWLSAWSVTLGDGKRALDMAVPALRQFLAGYDAQFVGVRLRRSYELEHELWIVSVA